jgi:hypothetical protein
MSTVPRNSRVGGSALEKIDGPLEGGPQKFPSRREKPWMMSKPPIEGQVNDLGK